ncbi:MAG TPA: peptidase MA family metallohydrolase [Candidatus Limnocylindrales bacterium]|nr:peptidase MA family metallohydrolase [Candidatus Limnocylindrales bacterium]
MRPRTLATLAALALLGGLLGPTGLRPSPVVAASAQVTFEQPSASGRLGAALVFRQPFSASSAPARVELLTQVPGEATTLVTPAVVTGRGSSLATVTDEEHVVPNTTIGYRFRVVAADGTASLGPSGSITVTDARYSWHTLVGKLVRLHWYDGDATFAQKAVRIGDDAVARVAKLLGVTETQPIDFFIYDSAEGLDGALGPGTSEFVAGQAIPSIRTLFAEIDPDQIDSDWVSTVIPHELTHLVFDTATHNPINAPPLWLNEGLAVYESEGDDAADQGRVRAAVANGTIMPLTSLEGPFPERQDLFYLSYAEAVSAVDYLVTAYGQPKLVALIRSYAGGVTDDEAFSSATGGDVAAFQAAWLGHIGAARPTAYGPLQAPPGATPPGWEGSGAGMGPAATPGPGAPSVAPVQAPSQAPGSSGSGSPLGLVVAVIVLAVLFGAGLLLIRRDRRAAR